MVTLLTLDVVLPPPGAALAAGTMEMHRARAQSMARILDQIGFCFCIFISHSPLHNILACVIFQRFPAGGEKDHYSMTSADCPLKIYNI